MEEKEKVTELTDILDRDVETIVELRLAAERQVSRQQRFIERVTEALGRPLAVYVIIVIVVVWIIANATSLIVFDKPPFSWLQITASLMALFMTFFVLTTQNRQNHLFEQRRQLDLQVTLLTERKVSKLIEMMDELQHRMPQVETIEDPEIAVMKEPVDPGTALTSLNRTFHEAMRAEQEKVK
jgi:uncharacterized membrane protein